MTWFGINLVGRRAVVSNSFNNCPLTAAMINGLKHNRHIYIGKILHALHVSTSRLQEQGAVGEILFI